MIYSTRQTRQMSLAHRPRLRYTESIILHRRRHKNEQQTHMNRFPTVAEQRRISDMVDAMYNDTALFVSVVGDVRVRTLIATPGIVSPAAVLLVELDVYEEREQ